MRPVGFRGAHRRRRGALLLLGSLLLGACDRVPEELRPDAVLRDSLGLGDEDRVHTVRVGVAEGSETAEPTEVTVRPGSWVQFVTTDHRAHTVSFLVDSLAGGGADFLRGSGQERSPPLVRRESRFVVSFEGAPPGRYPFLVDGTAAPVVGAVVVEEPRR